MNFTSLSFIIIRYLIALLSIAFFTLLERKVLGYIQLRKGPNKVGLIGIPQPLADALKLFTKELTKPVLSNVRVFVIAPIIGLFIALILWILYPSFYQSYFIIFGVLFFLAISRLNVYTTLISGWSSNSKYSLLGSLRRIAQTISYEVSIALVLMRSLIILFSLNIVDIFTNNITPLIFIVIPLFIVWIVTILAETNRTPFDFREGESELVSGFNTEYRRGVFALIFIAEYINIVIIRLLRVIFFIISSFIYGIGFLLLGFKVLIICFVFLWVRGTLPRIRYDLLINLTWKCYLPLSLGYLIIIPSIIIIII